MHINPRKISCSFFESFPNEQTFVRIKIYPNQTQIVYGPRLYRLYWKNSKNNFGKIIRKIQALKIVFLFYIWPNPKAPLLYKFLEKNKFVINKNIFLFLFFFFCCKKCSFFFVYIIYAIYISNKIKANGIYMNFPEIFIILSFVGKFIIHFLENSRTTQETFPLGWL